MAVSVMLAALPNEVTMDYETVWNTPEEPTEGRRFLVLTQWWEGNYQVRHIMEWEYVK
jgi:hypothetical protein